MATERSRRPLNGRIAAVALHDLVMATLSVEFALALRFAFEEPGPPPLHHWYASLTFLLVSAGVFWWTGLFRGMWQYASLGDFMAILKAVSLAILISLPILFLATRLVEFPRSVPFIQWPLLVVMLAGPRMLYRLWRGGTLRQAFERVDDRSVPVLLVGAGPAAETFIREMHGRRQPPYRAVALVDNKENRIGRDIHGVRVMGDVAAVEAVVERLARADRKPRRLILTDDRVDGAEVRRLLDMADRLGLTLARLPRLTDLEAGEGAGSEPRPIDVVDLLGRPQKVLDRDAMRRLIEGRRVLVTGAGGTIGGELCRQIAELGPADITLFDNGEHHLYLIDLELSESFPELRRVAYLGDVRDGRRLDEVFRRARPELVFHAAAYKHVPLVEANPAEALLTNAVGTRRVADACLAHGVAVMVLISTDKAVNPAGIMGASKRVAEMIAQALDVARNDAADAGTRFVTVRFGNVLGSAGSVVPLFQRQLARGGPLTVTHPDVSRYFMTQREAVELILQAAAMPETAAEAGRIYVLDMGEPVRIQDLARQMIRLAGRRPDVDVRIAFTGLRPGEKLNEELRHAGERPSPSGTSGILVAQPRFVDRERLYTLLGELEAAAQCRDEPRFRALVGTLVPELQPANTGGQRAAR
ncbi:MAG: polysaccharide biosynthesis protein [Alphaproteobacteria bacterium]|nr:polysaccharide biosynthesis protein [Alphaproteobacteria bacterium]